MIARLWTLVKSLAPLVKFWPLFLVLGAAVGGTFLWQRTAIRDLRLELAAAQMTATLERQANAQTRAAFDRYIDHTERALSIIDRQSEASRAAAATLADIEAEIRHAPATDNAPSAAVLARALERLRLVEQGTADRDGGDSAD